MREWMDGGTVEIFGDTGSPKDLSSSRVVCDGTCS
jgi:hypothetical protein